MGKRPLITEKHVLEALQAGTSSLAVAPNALITPLAYDTARERGLTFVTTRPEAPSASPSPRPRTHVVVIGSDHGGYGYKKTLKPFIAEMGWQVLDVGTDSEKSCDYPDFAFAVARAVALGKADFGVMIDGAGLGSAMVCNKVPGIRAACAYNEFTAWNARAHNDATSSRSAAARSASKSAKVPSSGSLPQPSKADATPAASAKFRTWKRASYLADSVIGQQSSVRNEKLMTDDC